MTATGKPNKVCKKCRVAKFRWIDAPCFHLTCLALMSVVIWHTAQSVHIAGGLGKWMESIFTTAAIYYRSQRPKLMASAGALPIFWGWKPTLAGLENMRKAGLPITYDDMVTRRFEAMASKKTHFGRTDALVEQDKCKMYEFFHLNKIPTAPVLGLWRNDTRLLGDIGSGAAFAKVDKWPVFLKCCHLTQGSAKSVLRLPSQEWIKDHWVDVRTFIVEKFAYRPHDVGRPWEEYGDILSADAVPGFLLQGPAPLTWHEEDAKNRIFEFKTHTYWGRSYFAELMVDGRPDWDANGRERDTGNVLFLRGATDSDAEFHRPRGYQWWSSMLYLHRVFDALPYPSWKWIAEEGHPACAWRLAERIARLMAIDHVRIDIFFSKGRPDECLVNEISLSSGSWFGTHRNLAARIWAEGWEHVTKNQLWGGATSKATYDFTQQCVDATTC